MFPCWFISWGDCCVFLQKCFTILNPFTSLVILPTQVICTSPGTCECFWLQWSCNLELKWSSASSAKEERKKRMLYSSQLTIVKAWCCAWNVIYIGLFLPPEQFVISQETGIASFSQDTCNERPSMSQSADKQRKTSCVQNAKHLSLHEISVFSRFCQRKDTWTRTDSRFPPRADCPIGNKILIQWSQLTFISCKMNWQGCFHWNFAWKFRNVQSAFFFSDEKFLPICKYCSASTL